MRIAFVTLVVLFCLAGPAAAESIFLDRVCRAEPVDSQSNGDVTAWRGIQAACCDLDGDNPYQASGVQVIRSPLTVIDSPAATCAADSDTPGWVVDQIARDGPDHYLGGMSITLDPGEDQIVEYTCRGNEFIAILYDCPCGVTEDGRACRQQQPANRPRQVLPDANIPRPRLIPQPRPPIPGGMPVPGTPIPMPLPPGPRTQ